MGDLRFLCQWLLLSVLVFLALVVNQISCGGTVRSTVQRAASCTLADLERDVGGGTLLVQVTQALLADDYTGAVSALVTRLGEDAVACAVLALDDTQAAQRSATSVTTSRSTLGTRAAEVIAAHGWRR